MSAAPKPTPSLLDRPHVEKLLADAEAASAKAKRDLQSATEQLAHAKEKHDEARTTASRRAIADAKIDLETAEDDVKKSADALERARTAMARLEREEKTVEYMRHRDAVVAFQAKLAEIESAFIALDRLVNNAVMTHGREFTAALDHYEAAEVIATHLHLTSDLDRTCRRPTLAQLRLDVTRAVTKVRLEENRPPLAPLWLAQADLDWKKSGASAADLESTDQWMAAEAQRLQVEREKTIANLGRFLGANEAAAAPQLAEQPQPIPTTPPGHPRAVREPMGPPHLEK
jgi:hypothetical protein